MAKSHFRTSTFVLNEGVLDLKSMLNIRRGLVVNREMLLPVDKTPDLPLVSRPVKPSVAFPSALKGTKPFELPTWSLATRAQEGRTVPAVQLRWTKGVIEDGEPAAIFEVTLISTHTDHVASGRRRRMAHSTSTILRVPSRLGNAAGALTWSEWESIATIRNAATVTLSFALMEPGDVQRLYRGITGGSDSAQLVVNTSAACVRQQRKVHVLDDAILRRPTHIDIGRLEVGQILPVERLNVDHTSPIGQLEIGPASPLRPPRPLTHLGPQLIGLGELHGRIPPAQRRPIELAKPIELTKPVELAKPVEVHKELLLQLITIKGVGPVVVGDKKSPAVVQSTAHARTSVGLDIDPNLFPELFSIPPEIEEIPESSLRRRSVVMDDRTAEYFEDTLTPGLYYYRPDAFRLERLPQSPNQPSLLFAFVDEIRTRDDGTSEPVISVEVTFNIAPSIDASTLRAIARQIAMQHAGTEKAVLLPLSMGDAAVELTLAGGDGTNVEISGDVTIRDGGTITLTMDDTTFSALIARLQSPGPAIAGSVIADEGDVIVPLSCSFFEPSTSPIDAIIDGSDVVLQNRSIGTVSIENVTLINRSDATEVAVEVTNPEVQPGEVVTNSLPDGITLHSHMIVTNATINTIPGIDTAAFWRPFAVTRGHLSTGRDLSVSLANPDALASRTPDPVLGRLTEVRIEIFNDTSLVLDADAPVRETRVRADAIASLFPESQDDAEAIMYRVVNVHSAVDGAVGGWTRTSASRLVVDPVNFT